MKKSFLYNFGLFSAVSTPVYLLSVALLKVLFPCVSHRTVAKTVVKSPLRPLQVPHGNDKGRGVLPQPTDQNLWNMKQKTIGTALSMKRESCMAGHVETGMV